ncbi:hypothetical protein TVAG_277880 [Trichomonas vaginalis G3]|uniref:Uncharacterized protein n=1 Tax=Trichomonas vaginalis (strain ATCC PRA-98 / G3) TaxID=412133 RepID=A2DU29_TRIV3|nr:hypothetical protein TVAGG3_0439000 [Trichomonas vaginalis G3]EAY16022.1 hypothetical protein TVAG_277880 [Trichomonas vaginalis G3]KAI5537318.1 hypothetical protein TVAGG3_0439000 [Trichomonas vaginalis G3]|eukprot:XP_001328245.1 hypothetical protein [Trichomonas vaginalis G3]
MNRDIAEVKTQIEQAEERIEIFKAECIKKESILNNEIANLKIKVNDTKELLKQQMKELQDENKEELKSYDERYKNEIAEMKTKIELASNGSNVYKTHRQGLQRARKEAELANLKHRLEVLKMDQTERVLNKTTKVNTNNTDSVNKMHALLMKIDEMDAQITEVQSSTKNIRMQNVMKQREMETKYKLVQEQNQAKLESVKNQYAEKQKGNQDYLEKVRHHADQKIQRYQSELQHAQEQLDKLNQLRGTLQTKYLEEETTMKAEINDAIDAVKTHSERIQQQAEDLNNQERKLTEILKENVILNQSIKASNMSLTQIKKDNRQLKQESIRMETQIYSDRMDTVKGSSFF